MKDLREKVQDAADSVDQVMATVANSLRRIIAAGEALLNAKEQCGHGNWTAWLEEQLPQLPPSTARRWMQLARLNETHGAELEKASTVNQAFRLAGYLPEPEPNGSAAGQVGASQSYLALLTRSVTHLSASLSQRPIEQMAPADRTVLRQKLEPLVEIYERLNQT